MSLIIKQKRTVLSLESNKKILSFNRIFIDDEGQYLCVFEVDTNSVLSYSSPLIQFDFIVVDKRPITVFVLNLISKNIFILEKNHINMLLVENVIRIRNLIPYHQVKRTEMVITNAHSDDIKHIINCKVCINSKILTLDCGSILHNKKLCCFIMYFGVCQKKKEYQKKISEIVNSLLNDHLISDISSLITDYYLKFDYIDNVIFLSEYRQFI